MADEIRPLEASPYLGISNDIQNLVRSVNRIAQTITPTPQTVSGSRASGAALESLLAALVQLGFIVDATVP